MSAITEDELELLVSNINQLSPDEQSRVLALIKAKERGYRSNKYLDAVRPNLHEKQKMFLAMDHREVLFGGAAGGGKSDAILMAALQYIDVPNYAAIIFRRAYTDLALPGAIMDRAGKWLAPFIATGEVHHDAQQHRYTFPSGSSLSFSYLENEQSVERYKSAEFQFIGIDELTEHAERTYLFLFSRLRRLKGVEIPIRMRTATNPGGKFGEWVKDRFITPEYLQAEPSIQFSRLWEKAAECGDCSGTGRMVVDSDDPASPPGHQVEAECLYCEGRGKQVRHFLPSKARDNKSLDEAEYRRSLALLSPVDRYRQEHGRWDISELGGLFKSEWFRFYNRSGTHFVLHRPNSKDLVVEFGDIELFTTSDTASVEKTTADFTVCCQWALELLSFNLILLGVCREKMEVPKIAPMIRRMTRAIHGDFAMIEEKQSGIGVIQALRGQDGGGLTVKSYMPHAYNGTRDKVARSTIAQNRFEAGQVYFPVGNPGWLQPCVAELLGFPESAHDDFVDCVSMACWYAHNRDKQLMGGSRPEAVGSGAQQGGGSMPSAWGAGAIAGGGGPASGGVSVGMGPGMATSRMPMANGGGYRSSW